MNSPDHTDHSGPLLLCYDGSADAKHAIESAATLLVGRDALVVTVWHPIDLGSYSGLGAPAVDFVEIDRAAAERGARIASEGVQVARDAGLEAEPVAIKATGPVWKTILDAAERHHASAIVMGSRGLTGVRSLLLGSVSGAVVHHADRPALVVHPPAGADDRDAGAGGPVARAETPQAQAL